MLLALVILHPKLQLSKIMKIRIKGNSIRYRLTKGDVDRFSKEGYLEETVDFGQTQLIYCLKLADEQDISANFNEGKITVLMSSKIAHEWTTTDRVGFENHSGSLYILIEKDFKCLDLVAEDQSDNYPNPNYK